MALTIELPRRSNAIEYDDDHLQDLLDTLDENKRGTGIVVDEPVDTKVKALIRSRVARQQLAEEFDTKVKATAVETEDGNWVPVVSYTRGKPKTPESDD